MKNKHQIFSTALLCIVASQACAMFVKLSLDQIVERSEYVIVGEIVRIKAPENKDATRKVTRVQTGPNTYRTKTESTGVILYDTAYILIDMVLKHEEGKELETGDIISFSMPSRSNLTMSSTDIRYTETDKGIWMLRKHKGKLWASHPMSLQKLEALEEIQAIINKQDSNQSEQGNPITRP